MNKRIVITGMGALGATGSELNSLWQAIKDGESGIADIDLWDIEPWEFKKGAVLKDYSPKTMLKNRKLLKLISRQDVIGLNAAQQAIDDSAVLEYREQLSDTAEFNDRTGVYIASPGVKFNQQYDLMPVFAKAQGDLKVFAEALFDEVHPMWLLKILSNNVLAYVGIENQFKGPNQNIPNHAISGTQAILEAMNAIHDGQMDRAVVVGYESAVEPQAQAYYSSIGTLSKRALRPFDHDRDGTVLAEAACGLFIETLESAQERGAHIYAELLGGQCVNEAKGIFPITEEGEGLQRAMQLTLQSQQVSAQQIGMITAHANGTLKSDASEANAIKNVFGENSVPVTGFKWSLGHSLSAAGILETALTVKAMQEGVVPGIKTLTQLADDCAGLAVANAEQRLQAEYAMVLSRGFASLHGSLLLKQYQQ